jgi:hypothetical protein
MPIYHARRGQAFDAEERAEILNRYKLAWETERRARDEGDSQRAMQAQKRMDAAVERYIDAVPIVRISRSPISGAVFENSLDIFGIDGLWWAYDRDYRPFVERVATFFAWTGALTLEGPPPVWSLKTMVGPGVPFVLPRMLRHPHMTAVISSLLIGEHVGYPIVYFADPTPFELVRVDDWGRDHYQYVREDGTPASQHAVQHSAEKDFELEPWLESGKLRWIAPGDLGLELRSGVKGCPYVGLEGERGRQYFQRGRSWVSAYDPDER